MMWREMASGAMGLDKNQPLRCTVSRVKLKIDAAYKGVSLREVQMGWLVPAAMLSMVVIAAVTLTRL
jgi:hypothetical protein